MSDFLQTVVTFRFEIAAVILFGIGFMNLLLQKNLIRKIISFNIMDSSIFLFLASQGFIDGRVAPIIVNGVTDASNYINPIPTGLVLTGIVVSVSVSAFFLALVHRLYKKYGTVEFDEIIMLAKKEAE
ncbi:MAG: NADH-quinone oxidoreductase subunit K [Clostridia bacterium]|nr:NADH-quinone oxidoreductase subunit K [Clostridia bacterium]